MVVVQSFRGLDDLYDLVLSKRVPEGREAIGEYPIRQYGADCYERQHHPNP